MTKRFNWYILFLICLSGSVIAQPKQDYNWLIGYPPNEPVDSFGGAKLVFS